MSGWSFVPGAGGVTRGLHSPTLTASRWAIIESAFRLFCCHSEDASLSAAMSQLGVSGSGSKRNPVTFRRETGASTIRRIQLFARAGKERLHGWRDLGG